VQGGIKKLPSCASLEVSKRVHVCALQPKININASAKKKINNCEKHMAKNITCEGGIIAPPGWLCAIGSCVAWQEVKLEILNPFFSCFSFCSCFFFLKVVVFLALVC